VLPHFLRSTTAARSDGGTLSYLDITRSYARSWEDSPEASADLAVHGEMHDAYNQPNNLTPSKRKSQVPSHALSHR